MARTVRVTRADVYAARARLKLDKSLKRASEPWVTKVAALEPAQSWAAANTAGAAASDPDSGPAPNGSDSRPDWDLAVATAAAYNTLDTLGMKARPDSYLRALLPAVMCVRAVEEGGDYTRLALEALNRAHEDAAVEDLHLGVRTYNSLRRAGVETSWQALLLAQHDFRSFLKPDTARIDEFDLITRLAESAFGLDVWQADAVAHLATLEGGLHLTIGDGDRDYPETPLKIVMEDEDSIGQVMRRYVTWGEREAETGADRPEDA